MVIAPLPKNEEERLRTLQSFEILDTDFERDYDELCQLAAAICRVPHAVIGLIDRDREWFKAAVGLEWRELDRDVTFCSHAILTDQLMEVNDARSDERFFDNPLVTQEPAIRFYAGQPLLTDEGVALGTLCAFDHVPRTLTPEQRDTLAILARQVVARLELRRVLLRLSRLNADKDRFFSIIGHDLRSPLSGIMNLVDLTIERFEHMPQGDVLSTLQMISASARRLYSLSEDLLQWAKLEQGSLEFHPEVLEIQYVLEEAVESLRQTAEIKTVGLKWDAEPGAIVRGDRQMLESAVRNLISNALKFSRQGSQVTVMAAKAKSEVVISVTDQGLGMDRDALNRLNTEGRAAVRTGTAGESGSGLGLTLVRQFARYHQGRVELRSELGRGTTAALVLPAYDPATHPVDQQS